MSEHGVKVQLHAVKWRLWTWPHDRKLQPEL